MASRKSAKKASKNNGFNVQNFIPASDSYRNLIYGIITVIVLFIVIALGIRSLAQNKAEILDKGISSDLTQQTKPNNTYTVAEGESLWTIAEKQYGDGYKWTEIAKANNISDPDSIEKGQNLILPKIAKFTPTVTEAPSPTVIPTQQPVLNSQTGDKITSNQYAVAKGDNLWDIAVRAYGDGYRWVDIAKANNLSNPDLIFSGNELNLPRP